jgi:hypothetical protein
MKLKLIVGYSKADFTNLIKEKFISSTGPLLGVGTWFGRRGRFFIDGKISWYKNLIEYEGEINKNFRKFNAFVGFYKINSFNELSIGVGKNFHYRLRKPKR